MTRFLASPTFKPVYDAAYRKLFDRAFVSGRADRLIDQLGTVLRTANAQRHLVDPSRVESDIERDHNFVAERIEYLRTVAPIAG